MRVDIKGCGREVVLGRLWIAKSKEGCEERQGKLYNKIEKRGRSLENVDDLHWQAGDVIFVDGSYM